MSWQSHDSSLGNLAIRGTKCLMNTNAIDAVLISISAWYGNHACTFREKNLQISYISVNLSQRSAHQYILTDQGINPNM